MGETNIKAPKTTYDDFGNLSAAERKVLLLMRNMRAYEKIEIKFENNIGSKISVVASSTLKEVFPIDME